MLENNASAVCNGHTQLDSKLPAFSACPHLHGSVGVHPFPGTLCYLALATDLKISAACSMASCHYLAVPYHQPNLHSTPEETVCKFATVAATPALTSYKSPINPYHKQLT